MKSLICISILITFVLAEPNEMEKFAEYWNLQSQLKINKLIEQKLNLNTAKNVIMFLGDGMSFDTITAARIVLGGVTENLSFDNFPYIGFSKTYCVDSQVGDGACTSTAYLSGVKTNNGMIGLNAAAKPFDCDAQHKNYLRTESIASWALKSCKSIGIVTTSRITDASPAGAYAHVASRFWENDREVSKSGCDSNKVDDIAEQLIYGDVGKRLKVILGGGRSNFLNQSHIDEEGKNGSRLDGKDLINEWKNSKENSKFIWNKEELFNLDINSTDYVLGLFDSESMMYNIDGDNNKPSLSDMTRTAIKMMEKDENGYFLFIEGGLIDEAHHNNMAQVAIDETIEFSKAVEIARNLTNQEDTLIVVTADHAQTMIFNGYLKRGDSIIRDNSESHGVSFTSLSYANGPGFNMDSFNFSNIKFKYPTVVNTEKSSHGGQDVGVWASGPQAHLFSGNYEQNVIPLMMAHALKIGPYADDEKCGGFRFSFSGFIVFISLLIVFIV